MGLKNLYYLYFIFNNLNINFDSQIDICIYFDDIFVLGDSLCSCSFSFYYLYVLKFINILLIYILVYITLQK